MKRLQDNVAIITGSAGGIGYATAEKFLEEGAIVVMVDMAEERLKTAYEELMQKGRVMYKVTDITNYDSVQTLIKNVIDNYGHIDILINNAGITKDAQFYKMELNQFEKVINVNLIGTVIMCKAVVPYMMQQRYGRIVNSSSVSAISGNFGQANYAASKGAIISFGHSLGHELAKYGITVNTILPGAIDTPMTKAIPPEIRAEKASKFPMRRWGEAKEVANVYAFLASNEASYINTAELRVDGGLL